MSRVPSQKCSTQICRVVSRKALGIGNDPAAVPEGQTINIGNRYDVSAFKKAGCWSSWEIMVVGAKYTIYLFFVASCSL